MKDNIFFNTKSENANEITMTNKVRWDKDKYGRRIKLRTRCRVRETRRVDFSRGNEKRKAFKQDRNIYTWGTNCGEIWQEAARGVGLAGTVITWFRRTMDGFHLTSSFSPSLCRGSVLLSPELSRSDPRLYWAESNIPRSLWQRDVNLGLARSSLPKLESLKQSGILSLCNSNLRVVLERLIFREDNLPF